MAQVEVVYVTKRREARDEIPKRRSLPHAPGEPLPRIGESVILDFDGGAPTRWIVQDVAHVLDGGQHEIVVTLAAPYAP